MLDECTILEKYKESGQKEVIRINHPIFNECILKKGKCYSQNSLDRIKREVDILKEINSPFFPKNYQFEFNNLGEFIIIEQYIDSETLTQCKDNYIGDEKKALELFKQLIDGLEIIWDKRIIHRDLKPDNILIVNGGRPVIIDLGIARVLDEKSLTNTIQASGPCTPIYASPEQLANKKQSIDIRTDFYSLAIIISELIIGEHPFSPMVVGEGIGIMDNLINNRYRLEFNNIKITEKTKCLIDRLLKKEPYQRIRNSLKLKEAINDILLS
ncbi:MAG: serine/threonine protein kinase [Clostridium argentinense]|nr:serine/threonine protein kinase [Clostridium argentinense]